MTAEQVAEGVTLHSGDCREVLARLDACSLDSCVTDPPYALVSIVKRFGSPTAAPAKGNDAYMRASVGFMGKTWDTGEAAMDPAFWAEVLRVLKPGAHLVAFGATRGYHRMACAIEDAGFEIRDSLAWLYGTGFPKSHDVSKGLDKAAGAEREVVGRRPDWVASDKWREQEGRTDRLSGSSLDITRPATDAARQWEGWGTALKPAFEPIVLARKPLSEKTVAANVLRWGTGAINVDACRVHVAGESTAREYSSKRLQPGATAIATGEHMGRQDIEFAGTTKEGRWPANVCHDGSDEVVGAFPTLGKSTGGQSSTPKGFGRFGGGSRTTFKGVDPGYGDSGSAARFFYSSKASKADRAGSKHPTVKPVALMEWLAKLVTPPGGVILDPFAGSGTTGAAAARAGFQCVLVEREAEYVADIKRRFEAPIIEPRKREQKPSPPASQWELAI